MSREELQARQEVVLQAMTEYAQAVRGNWSDFDGRGNRAIMEDFVAELRDPEMTIEEWRNHLGICTAGGGHWCGYWGHCDAVCGCVPCAEDRAAREEREDWT